MPGGLSQLLAPRIPSGSRSRGYSYFTAGAVRSLTVEHGVIQATVRGTGTYTVWIEPDAELLSASCTCQYFVDRLDICKHIWAVVLAAEAQSVPLVAPGVKLADVDLEPAYLDDDPDPLPGMRARRGSSPSRSIARMPTRATRSKAGWRARASAWICPPRFSSSPPGC